MDLEHVLVELRKERDAMEAAINSLEGLGHPSNLGRPVLSDVENSGERGRTRRHLRIPLSKTSSEQNKPN
jgi:hypothetical protein